MVFAASISTFWETVKSIALVLTACGCFLVGVNLMSRGTAAATIKSNLFFTRSFCCRNRFEGVGAGLTYTALVQSSDVTSVTLVRLADVGTITLFQACACIIGANIGTTLTTFIVSLSSFDLTSIFAFFAFLGAIPMLSKKKEVKTFGEIIAGFGILFIGIQLLESSMNDPFFHDFVNKVFNSTSNPLILASIAALLTAVVQSSSVVTSMVVFLVSGAMLPLPSAFALVAGANIGTCITSIIASSGSSRNARRVACFHTMFNVIGAAIYFAVVYTPLANYLYSFAEGLRINVEFKVALFHLTFNICTALVVIPLLKPLVWFSKKIIRH